jgi:ATP-dependent Clp protease ATP-binding subunit ClpC
MRRALRVGARSTKLPPFVEEDLVASVDSLPPAERVDRAVRAVRCVLEAGGRHPVLIAPPSAGKSAVVRGLAQAIAAGDRPAGARALWRVSLRAVDLATSKDGGLLPALAQVFEDAARSRKRPLVWIPDVQLARTLDVHVGLALLLERSGVRMVGEAAPPFDRQCAEEPELSGFLHPIRLRAASEARTLSLLASYRAWLASDGRVVRRTALARAVKLGRRAFPARALPGRAFDVLALAMEATDPARVVTAREVTRAARRALALPPAALLPSIDRVRASLERSVSGQPAAIDALCRRFALWREGLLPPDRAGAVILLAGPPGVGKSHLARRFARATLGSSAEMITLRGADLSEDWKVDQLLGQAGASSPDLRRGLLSRALSASPFSVILIDEVERAHPLLLRWALAIADEGAFVDGAGERVSLRDAFVLLTSNAGSDAFRDRPLGIGPTHDPARALHALRRAMTSTLPPELFERADDLIWCAPFEFAARRELLGRWVREVTVHRREGEAVMIEGLDAALDLLAAAPGDARALRRRVERGFLAPLAALGSGCGVVRARIEGDATVLERLEERSP